MDMSGFGVDEKSEKIINKWIVSEKEHGWKVGPKYTLALPFCVKGGAMAPLAPPGSALGTYAAEVSPELVIVKGNRPRSEKY